MDTKLDHARCDVAHCVAPGLFRSLKKGDRKKQKLDISHVFAKETLRFVGFEPLGADDLRIFQGLTALAGPDGIFLTPDATDEVPKKLRRMLATEHEAAGMDGLIFTISLRAFLREIGLSETGGNIRSLKASLIRIANVKAVVSWENGKRIASFYLLSFTLDGSRNGRLAVALNPRLASAILGKRPYCRVEMSEVRRIRNDAARLIHGRLCGFLDAGKGRVLRLETLKSYIWPSDEGLTDGAVRKRVHITRRALDVIGALPGWEIEECSRGRYMVCRPTRVPRSSAETP